MKLRKLQGKLKVEHAILDGVRIFLEKLLAQNPAIRSVIPGVIRPVRDAKGPAKVRVTVPTTNGWKAIALSDGARQRALHQYLSDQGRIGTGHQRLRGRTVNAQLEFSPERMREIGYRVIDRLVEHLTTLRSQPVGAKADPAVLIPALSEPAPEEGSAFETVLAQLEQQVLRNSMHVNHPRFLAYVPGPSNFVGAMADALASGYNVFAGTWISGSGPAAVELAVVNWLREACGFPPQAGGLFVSGGTMANLTALAVARHVVLEDRLDGATVYFSDQAHSSLEKALFLIGISPSNFRRLPSDDDFRLPLDQLARSIAQDRASGCRPFCVIANAGTTNTGAIDPLSELSALCQAERVWLHVDGAYGAAAALSPRGREQLSGMQLADSLSLDPHKWLFQPFEIGCVLVRDMAQLRDTFRILPEYLKDTHQYRRTSISPTTASN